MNAPKTTSQQGLRRTMTVSPDVRWSRTDDGGLLLDIKTSKYYSLNSVGATIWEGVRAGRTAEEISRDISRKFEAPLDTVQRDTAAFLTDLLAEGILHRATV